jgi:hypothetical protein
LGHAFISVNNWWKIWGFWGFALTSITTVIINYYLGFGIGRSLFGLTSFIVLYAVLHIKKENVSAWQNMD